MCRPHINTTAEVAEFQPTRPRRRATHSGRPPQRSESRHFASHEPRGRMAMETPGFPICADLISTPQPRLPSSSQLGPDDGRLTAVAPPNAQKVDTSRRMNRAAEWQWRLRAFPYVQTSYQHHSRGCRVPANSAPTTGDSQRSPPPTLRKSTLRVA